MEGEFAEVRILTVPAYWKCERFEIRVARPATVPRTMNDPHPGACRSLRDIKAQVEAEMREYGRRRLQEELQKEADRHGRIFPPQHPAGAAHPAPVTGAAPYASAEPVWEVGQALHGDDEEKVRPWVERRLHWLKHGQEKRWLKELAGQKRPGGAASEVVRRNQNYFAGHAGRMDYAGAARRDWPIGSGAVESACLTQQGRFKRPGQFWTREGLRHLSALQEARTNGHWAELWSQPVGGTIKMRTVTLGASQFIARPPAWAARVAATPSSQAGGRDASARARRQPPAACFAFMSSSHF